jgi:hypothetical protein
MKTLLLTFTLLSTFSFTACKKKGCTNPVATNFDKKAKKDDGSCKLEVPLKRFTVTVDLALSTSTQTDPKCFLDLDEGVAYRVSEANAKASVIDVVYARSFQASSFYYLESIGNFESTPFAGPEWNKTTLGINTFSNFNYTSLYDYPSADITATQFSNFTTVSQLKSIAYYYGGNGISILDGTEIGNVFAFKTQQNKQGVFKVINAQAGSNGFVTLEIIIEP